MSTEHTKDKKNYYLFVNDVLYDVSDFSKKHPGGSVIRTMLWSEKSPKDASYHFREFHYRQNQSPTSQVKELLNGLPRAPPELQAKAKASSKKTPRDVEMMKDFVKLRQELEKKGFFEPNIFWVTVRLLTITFFWTAGFFLLAKDYFALGMFILSWCVQQCGWLHHEGGHRSLTTNVLLDKIIQTFIVCIIYGGSVNFWNYQHNNHHANTQHEEFDTDVKTLPLVAFDSSILQDEKVLSNKSQKRKRKSFWIRHQWLTYLVSNLLIYVLWRFFVHIRYDWRKNFRPFLFASLVGNSVFHYGILHYFCGFDWKWTIIAHFLYTVIGLWLLLFHFTVSHTFTGIHNGNYNWVEMNAYHTVNVKDHWLVNIVMGLLNFQIEHHLFPQMAHMHARRAAPYVREFFKKHNLPYYEYGYFEGFSLVFKNLYNVGHDLPPIRPTAVGFDKKSE